MTTSKNQKTAFILWTPFQLFSAIHFIVDKKLVGKADAYIICQSPNAEETVNKVVTSGIFSSVKTTSIEKIETNQKIWEFIGSFISSKAFIRHLFGNDTSFHNYDKVFFSVPTRTNDIFVIANNYPEVNGLEDGIGSYSGDIFSINLGEKYKFFKRIRCRHKYDVHSLYLFRPEFYDGTSNINILNLVNDSNSYKDASAITHQIFNIGENLDNYSTYKNIYLNQPVSAFSNIDAQIKDEKSIYNLISSSLNNNLLVRLHPRESHTELYGNCIVDHCNPMWELVCSDIINEDYCLISCFSTAQFTPKLLFNKEPKLVFTYPLYSNLADETKENYASMVRRLRSIYSKPEKIIILDDESFLKNF